MGVKGQLLCQLKDKVFFRDLFFLYLAHVLLTVNYNLLKELCT